MVRPLVQLNEVADRTIGQVQGRFTSPLHSPRVASILGIALGISFRRPPTGVRLGRPSGPGPDHGHAAQARILSGRARQAAVAAAVVIATISVFAYPFVRGFGRRPDNPSAVPGDYGPGLAVVVAVVAGVALLWWLPRRRRRWGGA